MSFSTVLFDLDGTLLNTLTDLSTSVNYTLQSLAYPTHDEKTICSFIGDGMTKLIQRALGENSQSLEEALAIFYTHYSLHYADYTTPYANIYAMLTSLSDTITLGVVSNKNDEYTKSLVQKFFGNIFSFSIGKKDDMPPKPNAKSTNYAMNILNAVPEKTLYVGDSYVDFQTAKNAGISFAGVTWGFHSKEEWSKYAIYPVFHEPESLQKWILS